MKKTILFSCKTQKELFNESNSSKLGLNHYSYKIAMNKFLASDFWKENFNLQEIERPEIYKHKKSFEYLKQYYEKIPHLIWKPIEEIRILKNAYNIGILAWEFHKLTKKKQDTARFLNHSFSNQIRILSLLNEIWVPSTYSREVFRRNGLENTFFIPAPINENYFKTKNNPDKLNLIHCFNMESIKFNKRGDCYIEKKDEVSKILNENKRKYITFCNPRDPRKNLKKMILAFRKFSKNKNGCSLIIKIIAPSLKSFLEFLKKNNSYYKDLNKSELKNIYFICDELSEEEKIQLFIDSNYYFCLSKAEGQNLPLLEAMSLGIVPVSVDNTAMLDYIYFKNSFVIESWPSLAYRHCNTSGENGYIWFESDFNSIIKRLEESYRCTKEEYIRKSDFAKKTVQEIYSEKMVAKKIIERFTKMNNI